MSDTATRLALYKAHEARLLATSQSVMADGQGMMVMAQLSEIRRGIIQLEEQLASETASTAKIRRTPRMIVANLSDDWD